MAGREGIDLSRNEAEQLDYMVGVMVEQVEAKEHLCDNIIEIVHQYPIDMNNNALVREWSGIVMSTKRIINRVLTSSDRYTFLDL